MVNINPRITCEPPPKYYVGTEPKQMAIKKSSKNPKNQNGVGSAITTAEMNEASEEKKIWELTVYLAVSLAMTTDAMSRDAVNNACEDTNMQIIQFIQIAAAVCVGFIGLGLWRLSYIKQKKNVGVALVT